MKTITTLLLVVTAFLLSSCQGEQGPPGPPGADGLDGTSLLGSVFEFQGTFNSSNEYTLYYSFPSDFTVYDGDVVMVYIRWETVDATDGSTLDVWRPLPKTTYLDNGLELQYNFDYTLSDVQVYLDGTADFSTLQPADTDNQIFRVAVIPAELLQNKSVNINSLSSVMKSMSIKESAVKEISLKHPVSKN
ncbi:MAG TPA: hypothetical protein VKA27_14490 [Sunxiuqinia sp.]|nr:hypothetical protein [Sunxiuqinia sp.]